MSDADTCITTTAVVRVRGLGHALLESLDSLERQGPNLCERVLVTDGDCEPRALAALRGLSSRRGRSLIEGPENLRWSDLPGDAVLLLDTGDVLEAGFVARTSAALASDPSLGFVATAVRREWLSGRDELVDVGPLDAPGLLADPWRAARAALFRREALLAVGPLEPGLEPFERLDLWLRLLGAGWHAAGLPEHLLIQRPRRESPLPDPAPGLAALARRHLAAIGTAGARILIECQRRLGAASHEHTSLVERRDRAVAEIARLDADIAALRSELRQRGVSGVDFGELRRTAPVSREWGEDRGQPIDRFYIGAFVNAHRADLRGAVLEVQESDLVERYGGGEVERIDVVDIEAGNPRATVLADLRCAPHIPDASYDCFVLTQTLHVIGDVEAVLCEARRILRPGGVLLATFPAASRLCLEYGREGDYWRATEAGVRELFRSVFADADLEIERYGNLLTTIAFLEGLACHELDAAEFAASDPWYPLLFGVRATKRNDDGGARSHPRIHVAAHPAGAILRYHRVAEPGLDPHRLALPPAVFSAQMRELARRWRPLPLTEFAARSRAGTLPRGAVAVTLDDAYADALEEASPILLSAGVPATFFAVANACLAREPFWWDALADRLLGAGERPDELVVLLDGAEHRFPTDSTEGRRVTHGVLYRRLRAGEAADQDAVLAQLERWAGGKTVSAPLPLGVESLRALAARPGHTVGAHGLEHLALCGQPPAVQEREIAGSKHALESLLGAEVSDFSYPYGEVTASVARRARAAGFATAVSCEVGGVDERTDSWRLPRLEIHRDNAEDFASLLAELASPLC